MEKESLRFQSPFVRYMRGFTLIELLVTVAILGVILAIGIPNLKQFRARSQVSTLSTEFATDVARTRSEAINRNQCVSMCLSSNTKNALTGTTPTCATSGSDWQVGWIIFSNPTCSATLNNPTTNGNSLLAVRQIGPAELTLIPATGSALRRITFDARGLAAGIQKNLTLSYVPEALGSTNYRSICISSTGRVTVRQYGGTSACP